MKKVILVALLSFLASAFAIAQPRALGLRFAYGGEVSYQHSIGSNFIEADLGISPSPAGKLNQFLLSAMFDFVPFSASGFSVYVGPGVQMGFYHSEHYLYNFGVLAQVGVEYAFAGVPLNLSIDWRPAFQFPNAWFNPTSGMLGVRYRF